LTLDSTDTSGDAGPVKGGGAVNDAQEYQDVYAICDHMPGKERELRVGLTVVCRTAGWTVTLEPTAGNTGINQFMLHLDLTVTPPDPDAGVPEVITPVSTEWRQAPPALEYQQVTFHRSDAEPPPTIDVVHTE
jgi:hypothetical protein